MGEEITVEANRTKEELLQSTENEIKSKLSDTAKRIADEELRLAVCTKETAKFIELSQAIMRKHAEFLEKLETVRRAAKPKAKADQTMQGSDAKQSRPTRQPAPAKAAAPAAKPAPPVAPPPQPAPIEPSQEVQIDNIAEQIGSVVEQLTGDMETPPPAETHVSAVNEPPSSLFEDDDGSVKLFSSDDEGEISPRPKFDFDDLKFGANFDTDD